MTHRILFYTLLSLLLIVVDAKLARFLTIGNATPDILLIWIVYVAIREGQIAGTAAGFLIGLTLNLIGALGETTGGVFGLSPLAKTFAGFTAGYFYNENKTHNILGGYQFIVIVTVASIVHNIVYFVIFLQGSGLSVIESMLYYGIPATAFTAAVALLPMFVFARKFLS